MKIYASSFPPVPLVTESVFTNLFRTRFDDYPPDSPAYIDSANGFTITRSQTRDLSLSFAYGLRHAFEQMGGVPLARGDVVLILSPNSIAWPVMLFGGWAGGLRLTLANSAYTPREVAHQWQDSGAKAAIVHPKLLPVLLDTLKLLNMEEAKRKIIIADWGMEPSQPGTEDHICMSELLSKGTLSEEEKFDGEHAHETTVLCYSAGTTGNPKGVQTSHQNITTVLDISAVVWPDEGVPEPRMLGILPFYHIYGIVAIISLQFHRGVPLVIMGHFEPSVFCRTIERYRITQACVVPPICLVLSKHPCVDQFDLTSLKLLFSAAAPLSNSLLMAVNDRLHGVGAKVSIFQAYGLTETSPAATLLPAKEYLRKAGTVGILLPNLEARLVVDDSRDAEEGEPGEFWLRGPTVFKGYLNQPEATKNSITEDGWFKSGDILTRDSEGYFAVVDRVKELIKYKGSQVAPAELESILIQHPEIVDAGVIGIYSEADATELPRAYVVPARILSSEEQSTFAQEVQEWIKSKVARYKYLRGGVIVIDKIPKSAAGKILRRQLRDMAQQEYTSKM